MFRGSILMILGSCLLKCSSILPQGMRVGVSRVKYRECCECCQYYKCDIPVLILLICVPSPNSLSLILLICSVSFLIFSYNISTSPTRSHLIILITSRHTHTNIERTLTDTIHCSITDKFQIHAALVILSTNSIQVNRNSVSQKLVLI